MRYERLCAGGFSLGGRRFCFGSNEPGTFLRQQCGCTGKVVRKFFGRIAHDGMESYSDPVIPVFLLIRPMSAVFCDIRQSIPSQQISELSRRDHHRAIAR
ncbi:hypothetical protein ACVMH6_001393 [Rhizobium leguminosarum]